MCAGRRPRSPRRVGVALQPEPASAGAVRAVSGGVRVVAVTHLGLIRERNEDRVVVGPWILAPDRVEAVVIVLDRPPLLPSSTGWRARGGGGVGHRCRRGGGSDG